jgi:8-oxo-dGTP diphosphatase
MTPPPTYTAVSDIDWTRWTPRMRATLLFVVRDGQVLLIHKKRGLGAGKINGPGGRIEPGESPRDAAIREVEEELLVTPLDVNEAGELFFQFTDGLSIHGYVFRAGTCRGEPQETDEATPVWADRNRLPYDRMWEDDRYWVPLMLKGTPFRGYFLFDGDRMLDHRLVTLDPAGAPA